MTLELSEPCSEETDLKKPFSFLDKVPHKESAVYFQSISSCVSFWLFMFSQFSSVGLEHSAQLHARLTGPSFLSWYACT